MKITFKKGTKEMNYQCFQTNILIHDELLEKIEEHLNMIVTAFLFNEGEYYVPCYSFDGFIHKYGRYTHPVDEIIFYYYPDVIIGTDVFFGIYSMLNWELKNVK